MPARILEVKRIEIINKVFLQSLFFLIKAKRPNPAPDESPAITEPKLKIPFKYIIEIKTETEQFGINPKIPTKIG